MPLRPAGWDPAHAAGLHPVEALAYRSNLLGADRSLANWGGGNTSSKVWEIDHVGRRVRVLRVKGSGTDLATIGPAGFAGLRLEELLPLEERDEMADADMVDHLLRSGVDPGQPRPSIETLLHAFLPATHVDHAHPDAVIALTCAPDGRDLAERAFGAEAVWIDWVRPGFALSKVIAARLREAPDARFVLLEKHGLVTWGETHEESYGDTLDAVERARAVLDEAADRPAFGAVRAPALAPERRRELLARALPVLRGRLCVHGHHVLEVDDSEPVLDFVAGADSAALSQVGAACPDHLVNTKAKPLWVDFRGEDPQELVAALERGLDAYEDWYRRYYESNLDDETRPFPIDPPGPRVTLIPGVGMVTAGRSAQKADVSRQLFHRAIAVIGLAAAAGGFSSLSERESFRVEYWPLERYKLSLAPPAAELEGRVAVVTGGASGIGRASAELLAARGAHVAVVDLNEEGAQGVAEGLVERFGARRAVAVGADVTDESAVGRAVETAVLEWGGIDLLVANAGLASAASVLDTTVELWNRNVDVLVRGYFLAAREAVRVLRPQGVGGALVFVASKNAVAAGKGNAAYSAAKAAELHLARCLAEELGADGIRVNTVNPDAVVRGSGIFTSAWREARAAGYGIEPDELEEFYRRRTALGVNVFASDIAEAVLVFAGDRLPKTTGNFLNVDGGVATAYPR